MKSLLTIALILLSFLGMAQQPLKQGVDIDSGIMYKVNIDSTDIKVEIGFFGPMRLMQIVKSGFCIYFNEKGSFSREKGLVVEGLNMKDAEIYEFRNGYRRVKNMTRSFQIASFKIPGSIEYIQKNLLEKDCPVFAYFQKDDSNYKCVVRFPLSEVSDDVITDPRKLAIGFRSGQMKVKVGYDDFLMVQQEFEDALFQPVGMNYGKLDEKFSKRHANDDETDELKLWFRCK